MNQFARSDRFPGQLGTAICDHLIRIRVCARSRTGLKNVEWEIGIVFPFAHFFCGLDDQRASLGVEQSEIMIGLSGGPLNQTKRANERSRETIPADRKIEHPDRKSTRLNSRHIPLS